MRKSTVTCLAATVMVLWSCEPRGSYPASRFARFEGPRFRHA